MPKVWLVCYNGRFWQRISTLQGKDLLVPVMAKFHRKHMLNGVYRHPLVESMWRGFKMDSTVTYTCIHFVGTFNMMRHVLMKVWNGWWIGSWEGEPAIENGRIAISCLCTLSLAEPRMTSCTTSRLNLQERCMSYTKTAANDKRMKSLDIAMSLCVYMI